MPASAYSDLGPIVHFATTGNIEVRNGGAYAADSPLPYSAGTVYHLRLEVSLSEHQYSVFVTPHGGSEIALATHYAFRSEQSTVASLGYWDTYAEPGSGALKSCDLRVTTKAADAGAPPGPDAAVPGADAGAPIYPDAAVLGADAGAPIYPDAAVLRADASAEPGHDAGSGSGDAGVPIARSGCGCAAAGAGPGVLGILAILGLGARRRASLLAGAPSSGGCAISAKTSDPAADID